MLPRFHPGDLVNHCGRNRGLQGDFVAFLNARDNATCVLVDAADLDFARNKRLALLDVDDALAAGSLTRFTRNDQSAGRILRGDIGTRRKIGNHPRIDRIEGEPHRPHCAR